MSYFNADQEAHMDYIATIPPEERCYCGWYDADHVTTYRLGKCSHCPKGKTCADKLLERAALAQPTSRRAVFSHKAQGGQHDS